LFLRPPPSPRKTETFLSPAPLEAAENAEMKTWICGPKYPSFFLSKADRIIMKISFSSGRSEPIKRRIPEIRIFFLTLAVLFLLSAGAALAQTYKYVDENGSVHFVDSLDKIPAQHRKNIQVLPELKREERVQKIPAAPVSEKSLIGRWEYQGSVDGNSYTVIMSLRPKGIFDGNGFKKMGEKTAVWMFKGNWKVIEGDLALTYTWSSAPEPKRGSTQYDTILEVNEKFLELKSGKTGEVVKYMRK